MNNLIETFYNFSGVALLIAMVAAWITHVVASIQAGAYLLLIAGAFIFPVGIIHGIMVWLGVPWG